MTRYLMTIYNDSERQKAIKLISCAPNGTRLEVKAIKRSIPQNDRQWLLLSAVAAQLVWHGCKYRPEEWKDYFMHAYRGEKWMPAEDGGMVPIGRSTSDLSKTEHSEFTTLIEAFCARHGVELPWQEVAA